MNYLLPLQQQEKAKYPWGSNWPSVGPSGDMQIDIFFGILSDCHFDS